MSLSRKYVIDPRYLTGEKHLETLVDDIKENLPKQKLVLAFVLDQERIAEEMNIDYLKEVIRLAEIEDKNSI